jgi:hypothetical protein
MSEEASLGNVALCLSVCLSVLCIESDRLPCQSLHIPSPAWTGRLLHAVQGLLPISKFANAPINLP